MGNLWNKFQDVVTDFVLGGKPTPFIEEFVPKVTTIEAPMRSWRNEPLSKPQMHDLEEVVNSPGYDVLQSLWDSTLEGFVTFLVELPPEETDKVLAYHKIVHGLYLGIKSINAQVNGYTQLLQSEREESSALQAALDVKYGSDPLENVEVLNRVLNPIHQPVQKVPHQRAHREKEETPLDKMLRSRESVEVK